MESISGTPLPSDDGAGGDDEDEAEQSSEEVEKGKEPFAAADNSSSSSAGSDAEESEESAGSDEEDGTVFVVAFGEDMARAHFLARLQPLAMPAEWAVDYRVFTGGIRKRPGKDEALLVQEALARFAGAAGASC